MTWRGAGRAGGQAALLIAVPRRRNPAIRGEMPFFLAVAVDLIIIVLVVLDLALPEPGLLRVTSSLGIPTQILLDGQIADSWGLRWLKVAPGTHTVCFSRVEGWTEPACQTATVAKRATTLLTGEFIQRGWLQVVASPALPAQISVDGNPTDDWSMWTDIPTGSHRVCFGAVLGYDPPTCQIVTVRAGAQTTVTGTFTPNPNAMGQRGMGLLSVGTSPNVRSQILITPPGGSQYIADTWGLHDLELPPGPYTVNFGHVDGYTEPAAKQLSVTSGNTTTVTGTFADRGTLTVITSPPVAGTISVDGLPRDDMSVSTEFPVGPHEVCFGQAAAYTTSPACQTVMVNARTDVTVTGAYH
jgi:hypothetical protein